uniref:Uncharacterized protein n=1 Tax=Compsopogon caeruleus TaxID=31354 RepID=A0A7S1TD41_9RHOD|mmetsp:Transcript_14695/g.29920  ORF Transcript_14695/g.29920 Transcript_14695/m.29920 type:complete len:111 (+) Transcript_14695:89-421(+)
MLMSLVLSRKMAQRAAPEVAVEKDNELHAQGCGPKAIGVSKKENLEDTREVTSKKTENGITMRILKMRSQTNMRKAAAQELPQRVEESRKERGGGTFNGIASGVRSCQTY